MEHLQASEGTWPQPMLPVGMGSIGTQNVPSVGNFEQTAFP